MFLYLPIELQRTHVSNSSGQYWPDYADTRKNKYLLPNAISIVKGFDIALFLFQQKTRCRSASQLEFCCQILFVNNYET